MYIGDLEQDLPPLWGAARVGRLDDTFRVESPRAIAMFSRARSRRILLELVARDHSLAELASATGLSLSLLHYHVNRMRALGLVEVTAVGERSGRAVKRYRAVARAFLVPSHLAANSGETALAHELRAGLERDRALQAEAGVTYFVDPDGKHRMTRSSGAPNPRSFEVWAALSLSRSQAEALARDVRSLFATYADAPASAAPRTIAYCAFTERTG
jgi:DNA-binding transcriptional ArsR family regulator